MNIKTELVQKPINKGGFKYTYDYVINNEKYKSNVAKGTGNKTDDSISKFAGDFYQILTALRMQKAGQLYVPASGDGMFCVIYAYLAKHVYKITPRMIFIKGISSSNFMSLTFKPRASDNLMPVSDIRAINHLLGSFIYTHSFWTFSMISLGIGCLIIESSRSGI